MKPLRPYIRFGLICSAIVLLCNPNANLVDLLPDSIAYLLLVLALDTVDGNPRLSEARDGFVKLMWINVSKVPAMILMMMIWGSDPSQKSIISVFALSYAVIEIAFSLPAWSNFFDGIFYYGERHGADGVLTVPSDFGKVTVSQLPRMTAVFIVVKGVLSALPEMSLISVKEYSGDAGYSGGSFVISRYYPAFLALGMALCLVAGVIWASYLYRYVKHIAKEGSINRATDEILASNRTYIERKYKVKRFCSCLSLLAVAIGFQIDLIFDDVNILPDVISGILLVLFGRMALMYSRNAAPLMIVSGIYSGLCMASYTYTMIFLSHYSYDMIERRQSAAAAYRPVTVLSVVETVAAIAALVLTLKVIWDLIHQIYTHDPHGYGSISAYSSKSTTGLSYATFDERKTEELYRSMRRRAVCVTVVGILSVLCTCAQVFLNAATEFVTVDSKHLGIGHAIAFVPKLEWFWMIPLIFSIAWVWMTVSLTADLRRAAETRSGLV